MTKLVAEIHNHADIALAKSISADIWLVPFSALDDLKQHILAEKASASLFLELAVDDFQKAGTCPLFAVADQLCIRLSEDHRVEELHLLQNLSQGRARIASLHYQQASELIPLIATFGFKGIWLSPKGQRVHFLKEADIAAIGRLVALARRNHLQIGLSGGIEAPDIPRLLPFAPDWLGFCAFRPVKANQYGDGNATKLIRALIPSEKALVRDDAGFDEDLGTDRLLVRDFILPMEIGAYGHEMGHKQRVCFNIAADVARLSCNPEDMRHIFSYDLIMDGIRRLASLGHVELVETLAERIAAFILAYPQVRHVMVRVEKLDLGPAAVGVEIERSKKI